jgi:hypothetical protein
VPIVVRGRSGRATQVVASATATCVLLDTGTVECWGRVPGSNETWAAPTPVDAPVAIELVAAGPQHICLVDIADDLQCFGADERGQLGDGTNRSRAYSEPQRVWLLSGRGDANCDDAISSVDALYVLQSVAELLSSLPCPDIGAQSGQLLTSLDALAVLQLSADLLT